MDLTTSVSLISFSLSAFLAGLLFFDRERRPGTPLLAALLAIHSLAFLLRYGFTSQSALLVVYLPFVVFPLLTMHGPLVEHFVRRSLFEEDRTRRPFWPFAAGPLTVLVLYGLLFGLVADFRRQQAILAQTAPVALFSRTMVLIFGAYNAVFLLRAWQALRSYRDRFQESFSNLDDLRLEFLRGFLGFITAFYLAYSAMALVSFLLDWRFPVTPFESLLLLGLTYLVLYYLVRRPQIFTLPAEEPADAPAEVPAELPLKVLGAEPAQETKPRPESAPHDRQPVQEAVKPADSPTTAADPARKYARQSLDAENRRDYLERIQTFMETEQPYLDGELALADLAEAVDLAKHHVSMVINIEREQNFFQFVNSYRVDAARRLLADPSLSGENLLDIAFRAGFQSKAAFNKVFKKFTGQTPGQFRKAIAEKPSAG